MSQKGISDQYRKLPKYEAGIGLSPCSDNVPLSDNDFI